MPYLIWKSIGCKHDGLPIFDLLKDKRNVFFLDSSAHRYGLGRYSFLGFEPFYILEAKADANPFGRLRELLNRYTLNVHKYNIPFLGGAVGYFSYDLGLYIEKIRQKAKDDLRLPDLFFGFYDTVIAIDHLKKKMSIISTGFPEKGYLLAKKRAQHRLKQCIIQLSRISDEDLRKCHYEGQAASKFLLKDLTSNFSKAKYLQAIMKAKGYIRKGDIYQVNLSQRFSLRSNIPAHTLYTRLRAVSPSDFCAYFDSGNFQILSSSPERFLRYDGKKVFTRPMKGTRPRGNTDEDDQRQKKDLLKSAKDKAELIMIVDLLRNDLGRVCEYSSIKVKRPLRALEKYSTLYQTTATVEGILHKDKDRLDLLRACFPGGSITGCPKIRAMQIIGELEPTRRSIYAGALGYFGFNRTMDLNILIRTILKKDDKLCFQVGGGIVADSEPENEYQETLVKARGIFKAVGYL
jgi:para-aminobenzoate synthetase component 1